MSEETRGSLDPKVEFVTILKIPFKLQHPGNRKSLIVLQDMAIPGKPIDMVLIYDYCFEHVVFPVDGHDYGSQGFVRPELDTINPEALEVWGSILPAFLSGKNLADYAKRTAGFKSYGMAYLIKRKSTKG